MECLPYSTKHIRPRSTLEECEKIQELLSLYEAASGQMLNKNKTTLFFSRNTDEQMKEAIKSSLNVPAIQHYKKYLGFPSFVRRAKNSALLIWRKEFGLKCRGGRRNYCPKLEKESWSRRWFNLFPRIPWVFLKYWLGCVKTLKPWFGGFGEVKGIQRRSIGLSGVHFVPQRPWEVWVLEIFRNLIMLCLLNRYGICFTKRKRCYIRFLVRSIFQWGISLRLLFILNALMHGGVSCRRVM